MESQIKKIHFIGICGVAMSALAIAFKNAGWKVTGSDAGFYPPVSTNLEKNKIDFYPGWHPEKMDSPDLAVVGNVASSTNPEWLHVQEHKIPYKSYPEAIAEYFLRENSIVCVGTYGKTTSSALLSWVFVQCDKQPSYMFGGLLQNDTPSAALEDGDYSILEGDEYKSSRWDNKAKFFHYKPTQLLLTATQWDHADIYPTEASYMDAFRELMNQLPTNGRVVLSDEVSVGIVDAITCEKVTYGFEDTDYTFENVSFSRDGMTFEIVHNNERFSISTPLLGEYMAKNIVGCFAMAIENGLDAKDVIKAINNFPGIKRRLEKRADGDILVFDDIAHSPAKAAFTLATLKKIATGKIIAVFEPNTGNRKSASAPGYDNAFVDADEVIIPRLTKVKVAKDDTDPPFDGKKLAEVIRNTHKNVSYIEDDEALIKHLRSATKKDDIIVFLGSHGFRGMIDQLTSLHQ